MPNSSRLNRISAASALIQHYEQGPNGGYAAVPYRCPADVLTIGWGHRIQPHERFPEPLTAAQADALLAADLDQINGNLEIWLPRCPLTGAMRAALLSLIFNIGAGAFAGSTLLAQLRIRAYRAAADQFLRWNKATVHGKKVIYAGLSARRTAERALFLSEDFPP